jgi:hypothetical protein
VKGYVLKQPGEVVQGFRIDTVLGYSSNEPVYSTSCGECGTRGIAITHDQFRKNTAKCTSSTHFIYTKEVLPVTVVMAQESEPAAVTESEITEQKRLQDVIRAAARISVPLNIGNDNA